MSNDNPISKEEEPSNKVIRIKEPRESRSMDHYKLSLKDKLPQNSSYQLLTSHSTDLRNLKISNKDKMKNIGMRGLDLKSAIENETKNGSKSKSYIKKGTSKQMPFNTSAGDLKIHLLVEKKTDDTFTKLSNTTDENNNISEYLTNSPESCHEKLSFLTNNIKAKSLFRSYLSVEFSSISFYFLLWEQLQNMRDYIPNFTKKKFKKTIDLLYKRHFCEGAPFFIEIEKKLVSKFTSEIDENISFDILFDIEVIIERKLEPILLSFVQFLSEIPIDTLKRQIFGSDTDFYLPLGSKLTAKNESIDETQQDLLYLVNELSTSLVDEKMSFIQQKGHLKVLFLEFLKGNKENDKLVKTWKKFYEVFRSWGNKSAKENRSSLTKYYNKFLKGNYFEITENSRELIKDCIEAKKDVELKSLLFLKKELDIYMFLLIRSFIFENISVENLASKTLQKHASLRRRTYNMTNGLSQILHQMVEEEVSTKSDQELQEIVTLTQEENIMQQQFPIKRISNLVEYLGKNKVSLKDKLAFIFQDHLATNLLEIYCKSQYCYEALLLYSIVMNYTNGYKDSQSDLDFLVFMNNTFIKPDSSLCVTLTKNATDNVKLIIEKCQKNNSFPGVGALTTVFSELVEFFYTIVNQFVVWLNEKISKKEWVYEGKEEVGCIYPLTKKSKISKISFDVSTKLENVVFKDHPKLCVLLCHQILLRNNVFKVGETRTFWKSVLQVFLGTGTLDKFFENGMKFSIQKGSIFEGDQNVSVKINKQSPAIFVLYLVLFSSLSKQVVSRKTRISRQKNLHKKMENRDKSLQQKNTESPKTPTSVFAKKVGLGSRRGSTTGELSDQISTEFGDCLYSCISPVVFGIVNKSSSPFPEKIKMRSSSPIVQGSSNIVHLLESMFREFKEQVNMIPVLIRKIFITIYDALLDHFQTKSCENPEERAICVLGNLWNDFLEPILEIPHKYGILEKPATGSEKELKKASVMVENLGSPLNDKKSPLYNSWINFIKALLDKNSVEFLWKKEQPQLEQEEKNMRVDPNYHLMQITIFEYLITYKLHIFSDTLSDEESQYLSNVVWENLDEWI